MKIDIKNVLESYLRDKRGDRSCLVCSQEETKYSSLAAIADFLALHDLSLNAKNFEQIWEYVCGDNAELKAELDRAALASKLNDQTALEIYDRYFNLDFDKQQENIFLQAVEQIHGMTELISAGSENAIRHESQLIEQADHIKGGKLSLENAIQKMLDLSHLMVESTRENQLQISNANQKLTELQIELEVARGEADQDNLTRLPNRRKFERDLDTALRRLHAERHAFVLVFVDIDHFKRINDTFGHPCGDRVLRMIANQLSLICHDNCDIFRYGGEEFAILFEDDDVDHVLERMNECRDALAAKSLVDIQSGRPIGRVTFSAGIAQCLSSDSKQSLVRKADLALYHAKSEGRNMATLYTAGVE